jgi:predicted glycosyltransferase
LKVWLDLSNSPHPLLFAPVARALEEAGHEIVVSFRDNAQTAELTRERWPSAELIGEPSPPGRMRKAAAIAGRVKALRSFARSRRPDVALSHNSYAQVVAARSLGIPAVTAMDYEHQPANHLAFRLASAILLPEALRGSEVGRQGANERKVVWYAGLKEELYLGDFEPRDSILEEIGVSPEPESPLVVARTPPSRAVYHAFGNELFEASLRVLAERSNATCVVLPRHTEQRAALAPKRSANIIVPARAVDSRSLLLKADLMLGAGGTMTREAALLGVPTFTVFAGRKPAADRWLEARGMLKTLEDPDELARVEKRKTGSEPLERLRTRSHELTGIFVETALTAAVSKG